MSDSSVDVDVSESEFGRRLESMEGQPTVSSLIELSLELLEDDEGSFEDFCRAVSFGEAYLPFENEQEGSKYYNEVYSRMTSRTVRLRVEGERLDGERASLIDAVERLAEYETDASQEEMEAFIAETEGDWLDSLEMFWDYDE